MKLTLLKWKYQIVKKISLYDNKTPVYEIYQTPYGLFKFLFPKAYKNEFTHLDNAVNWIENRINNKKQKPQVIKEYYL